MREIAPCLWFDTEGEEAATFYTSVFPSSRILNVTHYGPAGPREEGMVLTVEFELNGQKLIALNGGPDFTFNEAVSLHVSCESQEEVDAYWSALVGGGEEGPCGWLKDRFGVSWQIDPDPASGAACRSEPARAERAMRAMLAMKKIDIAELERAASRRLAVPGSTATPRVAERAENQHDVPALLFGAAIVPAAARAPGQLAAPGSALAAAACLEHQAMRLGLAFALCRCSWLPADFVVVKHCLSPLLRHCQNDVSGLLPRLDVLRRLDDLFQRVASDR